MKKILSLVLALCLAFGLVSFASAEEALPTFDQLVLGDELYICIPRTEQSIIKKIMVHGRNIQEHLK